MVHTTIVRPADPTLREALRLALLFSIIKLAVQVAGTLISTHYGYGYFRDELYYLVCGQHLAWGYVDQGPIVAVQARFGEILFGKSLVGIRMFSALAGAVMVGLTGMLAWALGGRRSAQGLAMIGVLVAPQYLGLDSYLSMNSFEPMFWMGCLLLVLLIANGASPRWWLLFGITAGLGLLNKPSMTFFLLALLFGLLLTPQRRLLGNRWVLAGVALMVSLALPNLLWQIHYHWPTWEFLRNGQIENKNVTLGPLPFLLTQIKSLHPLNLFLWGAGLLWTLFSPSARSRRWIGLTYLLFFALMMALHAKDYYVTPIYPVLFAAGGVAWERRLAHRKLVENNRAYAFPIMETALLVTGALILPMAIPVLPPQTWIRYTSALHLHSSNSENNAVGPLPQFYADRFGWQEEVDSVTRIYRSLSPADRARVGILCSNYGEASAINFLGAKDHLPFAISGHNNYYLWGPHGYTGEIMIVINGASPEEMREYYSSVVVAGRMDHPYAMPYEHRNIYLVRGRKKSVLADWAGFKNYI
jgi:hypothetical protein